MKKLVKKSIFRFVGVSALIMAGLSVGQFAYAGWNDVSSDCPTVSVGNDTTREGTNADVNGCWDGTNITASEGDRVVVKVYFRNNTGATANDVRIKVSDNRNDTGTVNATGSIIVGSGTVKNGSGTIRIPSGTKLVYSKTYVQYKRTGYAYEDKGATTSVFGLGLSVGPITSTVADQGIVKVVYTVESTGGSNNGDAPVATTGNYSPYSETGGTATLHGSVAPNGDSACSYFEILKNGSNYDTTDEECSNQTNSTYNVPNESLTGLPTGVYKYRLYAYNDNGEDYGDWKTFSINRGSSSENECEDGIDNDDDGDVDYPEDRGCTSDNDNSEDTDNDDDNSLNIDVTTQSYSWIDEDSGDIKLYGEYDDNDNGSTVTYFEYRRDGGSTRSVLSGTYSNTSRTFSASLYNLSDGDYEYRACADNGDVDCGSWKDFSVDDNNDDNDDEDDGDLPTVQTLSPFQITYDFVTFDGYYDMNGCSGRTYFEYGKTTSFGSQTSTVSRSSGASGSMTQSVAGLSSNTTYYYRAVGENCEGTVRGATRSFKTTNRTVVINDNPTTITTVNRVVTTNIGGGARYIRLTIDNGRDTIVRGDELIYDVSWENVSNTDLKDLVLEVTFPEALQITSTDRGQIDRDANAVYVNINELDKLEKDDMTIRARITGTLKDNDPITARAIMAFENPENKAQENAIAYDSDSYLSSTNVLGASIFGLDFLPGTLAGWLFIILLLVLLILIIRYATRREEHHHYYKDEVVPTPTRPVVTTTTTSNGPEVDYTPYRPTPKDF